MFETLVESGARPRSPAGASIVSAAVHIGIVAGAIALTAGTTELMTERHPVDLSIVYQDPVQTTVVQQQTSTEEAIAPMSTMVPVIDPLPITGIPLTAISTLPADPLATLRQGMVDPGRTVGISTIGSPGIAPGIGGVLLAGEVDDPVRVLNAITPKYPRVLENAAIAGRVVLQFVVDTTGRIEPGTLLVAEASDSAFARASRDALEATRFAPARIKGTAVRQLVRQTHLFRSER